MVEGDLIPALFYQRPVVDVARELLGKRLIRQINGRRIGGIISETEAYDGEQDKACHARSGRTNRNAVMYGNAGRAYVYFTYGMHWMLNCVCGPVDYPAAVLIRAIIPQEGLDFIEHQREGIPPKNWCNGPARLTRSLAIGSECNNMDLTTEAGGLYLEFLPEVTEELVIRTPRIGIQYAGEPWISQPWRFLLRESGQPTVRES